MFIRTYILHRPGGSVRGSLEPGVRQAIPIWKVQPRARCILEVCEVPVPALVYCGLNGPSVGDDGIRFCPMAQAFSIAPASSPETLFSWDKDYANGCLH
jgi:hypothetical protein